MATNRMVFEALVIKNDLRKVELLLGAQFKKAPEVVARALNRAAEATRTQAVKETSKLYFVTQKDVRRTITISHASKTRLRASAVSADRKLPLEKFRVTPSKPRPRKPPVLRVGVKRDGMKPFPGAFVIPNLKIYKRVGRERYPIQRIYGPAIPQMLSQEKTRSQVQIESQKTYQKRLDHEIKRVLEAVKK